MCMFVCQTEREGLRGVCACVQVFGVKEEVMTTEK